MDRVFITLSVFFALGNLLSEIEAQSIPVLTNGRIQGLKGRKCLNFLWDSPCDHPYCMVTLKIKLQGGGNAVESEIPSYKPDITKNNASFVQCIYASAGENVSCCDSINSQAHLTNGHSVSFSNYEKISFHIKVCLNASGNCVSKDHGFDYILPWYNPCKFDNPCQNSGTCSPGVDAYNCSCTSDWEGYNCTTPKGFTYHAGKCLDYSSNTDVKKYMKTVSQCSSECTSMSSRRCKSFEFKEMTSGNHGNCTLRDSNSLVHSLVACDADLYEITGYLEPSSGTTVATVTRHLLVMLVASIFFLAQY